MDHIGDGLRIDFPVKIRPFRSWSPKTHALVGGETAWGGGCYQLRPWSEWVKFIIFIYNIEQLVPVKVAKIALHQDSA